MFINTKTLERLSPRDLRRAFPDTSFPSTLMDYPHLDIQYIRPAKEIEVPYGYYLVAGDLEVIDGVWHFANKLQAYSLTELKDRLKEQVTQLRWEKETGGINIGDVIVATDVTDQNRISSVLVNAESAGVTEVRFKAAEGWVTLTIEALREIAAAIAVHVQECFTAEYEHHSSIDVINSIEELAQYNIETGWPNSINNQV